MNNAITLDVNPDIFNDIYLEKAIHNQERVQIYYGGSSSGKSYALVGQRTVLDMMAGGRNYIITRNVANTIAGSVWNEVVFAINEMGLNDYFRLSLQRREIICKINGFMIFFRGLDDVEKIKSIRPMKGVITDIVMEEATENSYESYKQLLKRQRGIIPKKYGHIKKRVSLLFNPILRTHWIYSKFFKGFWTDTDQYQEKPGLTILKTTYKDNIRFLTDADVCDLENEDDPYYHEVYTLGNWGVLGAVIFKNWRVEEFDDTGFDKFVNGLDWGFARDPLATVRTHFDKNHRRIYIIDEIYEIEMMDDESAAKVKKLIGYEQITCDSSEPKSVAYYQSLGIYARGSIKGPGSIEFGIKWLQGCEIIVHPRCQNMINELQQYQFKKDKEGNVMPKPIEKFDHLIDALRYAYEDIAKSFMSEEIYEDQNNDYNDDYDPNDEDEFEVDYFS